MSARAARGAEYQASQNQSGPAAGIGGSASAVRWSSADERALEEAVVRMRMGLLFVGVKPYIFRGPVSMYPSRRRRPSWYKSRGNPGREGMSWSTMGTT